MTDDEPLIRHVRLCECGLPAGHDSICAPSRLAVVQRQEDEWAEANARRREERHAKRQARSREERAAELARATLLDLCHQALAPDVGSTVAAGSIEPSRGGGDQAGPPRQQTPDSDPRVKLAKRHLRRAAEQLIRLRWEDHGWESTSAATVMLGEHKDTEILKCEGARPREVVALLGAQVAGGSRTVERVREAAERCRWCGQRWPG